MKKAIVTLVIGGLYEKIWEIARPTFEKYASKVGAEIVVLRGNYERKLPHYQKRDLAKVLEHYDRALFIDADILIRSDAPDLFEMVPADHLGLFEEGAYQNRVAAKINLLREIQEFAPEWLSGSYYNTGVMVCSKEHAPIFKNLGPEINNFGEQTLLNLRIHRSGAKVFRLPYRCNRMLWVDKMTGESRLDSYFLHYAGVDRGQILSIMAMDRLEWESGPKEYPQNICLYLEGGLGDQVACEPIVRYCAKTLYPGARFVLFTHYPELFTHYPEIEVRHHGDTIDDVGFYEMWSLPKESYRFTHALTHPLDYSSLLSIGRQLVGEERRVILPKGVPAPESVQNAVLIHPGKSWPSKTFPVEFWEHVVDEVTQAGLDPILIGRSPNVVPVSNCETNRIDCLTLPELIGYCRTACALISNDSAPVHIAGACGLPVGLISTVKDPHHIMPYGARFSDLAQGRVPFDTRPNQLAEVRADEVDPTALLKCLPGPGRVREFLEKEIHDIENINGHQG